MQNSYWLMIGWTIILSNNTWLVAWSIWIIFPDIGNLIFPTDELIFFRGVGLNHQPVYVYIYMYVPLGNLTNTLLLNMAHESFVNCATGIIPNSVGGINATA